MSKKKAQPVEGFFDAMGSRIGDVVRKHRTSQRLTYRQLSGMCGIPIATLYATEISRRRRKITVERICQLSVGLGKGFVREIIAIIDDFTDF